MVYGNDVYVKFSLNDATIKTLLVILLKVPILKLNFVSENIRICMYMVSHFNNKELYTNVFSKCM